MTDVMTNDDGLQNLVELSEDTLGAIAGGEGSDSDPNG